jgi:hypothetical protein
LATFDHTLLIASWICNQVLHQLMKHEDRLWFFLYVILHLSVFFYDETILLGDLCQANRTALHSSWTYIKCMSFFPLVYLFKAATKVRLSTELLLTRLLLLNFGLNQNHFFIFFKRDTLLRCQIERSWWLRSTLTSFRHIYSFNFILN